MEESRRKNWSIILETLDQTEAKVMLLHYGQELSLNAVSRMLGLRNVDDFGDKEPGPSPRSWISAQYRDKDGALWNQLDLASLVAQEEFLEIGI